METLDVGVEFVLDRHPFGVAGEQLFGGEIERVGDQHRGVLAADVAHGELAYGVVDAFDLDQFVVDLGFAVAAAAVDADFRPFCVGQRFEVGDQLRAAFAQGQPPDPAGGEFVEDLVGREFGVEHEQARV